MRQLGHGSLVLTFVLAGSGMLMQWPVEQAEGNFFERVEATQLWWYASHLLLLLSVAMMILAGLTLANALSKPWPRRVGTLFAWLLLLTSLLLAGQYSLDFAAPLAFAHGEAAMQAYLALSQQAPTALLFYGLANLPILMLLLLTLVLLWDRPAPTWQMALLLANWALVLLGNLIDPLFQRLMIVLLAVHYPSLVKPRLTQAPLNQL